MVDTFYLCFESEDGVSDGLQVFAGDVLLQDLVKVGMRRQGQEHPTAKEPAGCSGLNTRSNHGDRRLCCAVPTWPPATSPARV